MTSFALSLGSGLIAFGPLLALFSSIIYSKAQLVIVVTSSAFFFLLSSVVASLFWWVFDLIGLQGPLAAIIPGVLSQFIFRCWFVSIYHRVERAIQHSVQQHEAQQDQQQQRSNNSQRRSDNGDPLDASEESTENNNNRNKNSWTEVAKLRLELNDASCGIAAGVGFGGMHAVLLYGTLLASEMTNNVGVLYQDSCPAMPSLAVSAIYACCFSILDIFFMLFTFFGMRRRRMYHRGERPPAGDALPTAAGSLMGNSREGGNMALLTALLFHLAAALVTVSDYFDRGCMVSLPVCSATVLMVAYAFWAGVGQIYMPPQDENNGGNNYNHRSD